LVVVQLARLAKAVRRTKRERERAMILFIGEGDRCGEM
jgi:hypothetical protein